MTQMCMLHFTRHYIDILQEMLLGLTLFAANLLRYMCAKNYYNIAWFDKLMAKIKRCSFFASQCTSRIMRLT